MTETTTVTGLVASAPRHVRTSEGLDIASFSLASARRQFDYASESWVVADTNWYTVTALRELARNVGECVMKGQNVIVIGRVTAREGRPESERSDTQDLAAETVGHDLRWGIATYSRRVDECDRLAEAST